MERADVRQVYNDLGFRGVPDLRLKESGDFDDSDCYGLCRDIEQNAGMGKLELKEELKFKERELESYGEDTQK